MGCEKNVDSSTLHKGGDSTGQEQIFLLQKTSPCYCLMIIYLLGLV